MCQWSLPYSHSLTYRVYLFILSCGARSLSQEPEPWRYCTRRQREPLSHYAAPFLTLITIYHSFEIYCGSWIIHNSYSVPQIEHKRQHEMYNLCLTNVKCCSFETWQDATTVSSLLLLDVDYKGARDPFAPKRHHSLLVISGHLNIYYSSPRAV